MVCHKHIGIAWAQAHGTLIVFDNQFRFAENDFYPAAVSPRCGQVRIERERPIDKRGAGAEVVDQIGKAQLLDRS